MLGGIKGLGRLSRGRASVGVRGVASGSMGQTVRSGTSGVNRGLTDLGNAGKRYMFDAVDEMPDTTVLNPVRSMGGTAMPGRVTASRANYDQVLEARRKAKLASSDPGLSTRGRVRTTAATRGPGLETRGVRPLPGTRLRGPSGPRGGTRKPASKARATPAPQTSSAGGVAGAARQQAKKARATPAPQTSSAGGVMSKARQQAKKVNGMFKDREIMGMNVSRRTQMGILAGGAAAYAVTNRRGQGTSSGSQSVYRY